jgi:hypothetical protein
MERALMDEELTVLTTEDACQWRQALASSHSHDTYHLPEYHRLAERLGEGRGALFVYRRGPHQIALPLLLRSLGRASGPGAGSDARHDAAGVYGYPGPVSSQPVLPPEVVRGFGDALRGALRARGVVSVFSRLHPLLEQPALPPSCGEQTLAGTTVSIDLTLPLDEQRARYRGNHKRGVSKLIKRHVICTPDWEHRRLDEFADIYQATMRRVGARGEYLFDRSYFHELIEALGEHAVLFTCTLEDELLCGGVFLVCRDIVQYHLGATADAHLELAPTKLMFDAVRIWATERGLRVFHLGGGLGGRRDSLLHFKQGFSDRSHPFRIWRWIVDSDAYARLCAQRDERLAAQGLRPLATDYFPAYRAPDGG